MLGLHYYPPLYKTPFPFPHFHSHFHHHQVFNYYLEASIMVPNPLPSSVALLLSLNLFFFFTLVSSSDVSSTLVSYSRGPKVPGHSIPIIPGHSFPAVPGCPKDTLKLGVCGNLLNGLVNLVVGTPATTPCCSLLSGLTDVEAAACLCTAVKANVLGIHLHVPVSLSLLLNSCGMQLPYAFKCL